MLIILLSGLLMTPKATLWLKEVMFFHRSPFFDRTIIAAIILLFITLLTNWEHLQAGVKHTLKTINQKQSKKQVN